MRRSALVLGVVVALAAFESDLVVARGRQVPGTFRTQITIVPLDVRVIDRDGRPVTDLTRDDFVVLENNARQTIVHFSHDLVTPQPASPDAKPALRKQPSRDLVPQNQRIFLLVMGRGRLQVPSKGVDAAIRFVNEQVLPQDLVSVFAYNRATTTTNRTSSGARS